MLAGRGQVGRLVDVERELRGVVDLEAHPAPARIGMIGLGAIGVWCMLAPLVGIALYFTLRPPVRALAAGVRRAELRPVTKEFE